MKEDRNKYAREYRKINSEKVNEQARLSKQRCRERDLLDQDYNKKQLPKFLSKIQKMPNGCWNWIGSKNKFTLYGTSSYKGKMMSAHRVSYILFNDKPIPKELQVDHLCKNKICVNPIHLEAVTRKENLIRAGFCRGRSESSKCINGHEYIFVKETVYGKERTVKRCPKCIKFREKRINEKMSYSDYEKKIEIEKKLLSNEKFDRTEIIEKGMYSYGKAGFKTAIKLKLLEKGVNVYGNNVKGALKWLGALDIPIEELAKELDLKPIRTCTRIPI